METDKRKDSAPAADQAVDAVPKSPSRRHLLRASLGASPVLLTVVSRPVHATYATCRAPSALASIQANAVTSRAPAANCGTGQGPVTWKSKLLPCGTEGVKAADQNYIGKYPLTYPEYKISGSSCSKTNPVKNIYTDTPTLRQILLYSSGTSQKDILARNIAATLLNVLVGASNIPGIDANKLRAMWQTAGELGGSYAVNGVSGGWNASKLNIWLAQTWMLGKP